MSGSILCNATITADPDVAGLGIIISFVLTAWITNLVAVIPALAVLQNDIPVLFPSIRADRLRYKIPRYVIHAAEDILRALCDIQLLTGLSIIIAGLATLQTSTYYHQQMVMNFWWLTLNSFWVARIELDPVGKGFGDLHTESNDEDDISEDLNERHTLYDGSSKKSIARLVVVVISVILGAFYQSWIQINQIEGWDSENGDKCFIYNDFSPSESAWFWVAGLVLYAIALLLVIFSLTRKGVSWWLGLLKKWRKNLWKQCRVIIDTQITRNPRDSLATFSIRKILNFISAMLLLAVLIFFWLSTQVLAVVSYGNGWYPILLFAFTFFAAWTTWDIVDIKLSNLDLIGEAETSWGFGQVLPMILLLGLCLQFLDAFDSEPQEKKNQVKHNVEIQSR